MDIGGVSVFDHRLFITAVVTPHRRFEVRMVTETQRRSDDMAEFLHFAVREEFLQRGVESVQLGIHAHSHVEVEHIEETGGGIHRQRIGIVIPVPVNATEIHAVADIDVRSDVQIFEQRKTGINRKAVIDSYRPVAQEIGFEEILLFDAVNGNLAVHRVAHLDLLVPFFFSCHLAFAFERSLTP